MKPRNWRTYYWYRPPSASPGKPNGANERAYLDWLCAERGWSMKEAKDYCGRMDTRKLISATHNGPMLEEVPLPKAEAKPRVRTLTRETPKPVAVLMPAVVEPVPEIARRRDAAALLRELAANYGPRRAHKLRAMADFLEAPAAKLRLVREG